MGGGGELEACMQYVQYMYVMIGVLTTKASTNRQTGRLL